MKVTYISADDWAGVYVNGKLFHEGHSIHEGVWMDLLRLVEGVEIQSLADSPIAYRLIEREGRCPSTWPPQVVAG